MRYDLKRAFYEQVATEIAEGKIDQGMWAQAFAEERGDEARTKARYLRIRVDNLHRQLFRSSDPPRKSNQIKQMGREMGKKFSDAANFAGNAFLFITVSGLLLAWTVSGVLTLIGAIRGKYPPDAMWVSVFQIVSGIGIAMWIRYDSRRIKMRK